VRRRRLWRVGRRRDEIILNGNTEGCIAELNKGALQVSGARLLWSDKSIAARLIFAVAAD